MLISRLCDSIVIGDIFRDPRLSECTTWCTQWPVKNLGLKVRSQLGSWQPCLELSDMTNFHKPEHHFSSNLRAFGLYAPAYFEDWITFVDYGSCIIPTHQLTIVAIESVQIMTNQLLTFWLYISSTSVQTFLHLYLVLRGTSTRSHLTITRRVVWARKSKRKE